jgi:hypothetical protein
MQRIAFVCAAALLLTSCQQDPKSIVITEENRQTVFKDLQGKLSEDESRALMAFIFRAGMANAFAGGQPEATVLGKTVGQIIEEQRTWEKQRAEEEAQRRARAEEARQRAEAITSSLRQVLDLRVTKKKFQEANIYTRQYQDQLVFTLEASNYSEKPLRAFTGKLRFNDLFGKEIYTSRVQNTDALPSKKVLEFQQSLGVNPFFNNQQLLKTTRLQDMKTEWIPTAIIFADGTQIGEDE